MNMFFLSMIFFSPFVYIVFILVTHCCRRVWCAADIKVKILHATFFVSGPTFCDFVFVNFLINSTFELNVANFARRHEWHSILIYTAY